MIYRMRIGDTEQPLKRPHKKASKIYYYEDCTLRQAVELLALLFDVSRLPIVSRNNGTKVLGVLTRSDILAAYRRSLEEQELAQPSVKLPPLRKAKDTSVVKGSTQKVVDEKNFPCVRESGHCILCSDYADACAGCSNMLAERSNRSQLIVMG
ncbi:MAG: CBS domain-containing protein [Pirellulales bacterium]